MLTQEIKEEVRDALKAIIDIEDDDVAFKELAELLKNEEVRRISFALPEWIIVSRRFVPYVKSQENIDFYLKYFKNQL